MDQVLVIPGLSSSSKRQFTGKLLRRPRAPRQLPPLVVDDTEQTEHAQGTVLTGTYGPSVFGDAFSMFDISSEEASHRVSPIPSGAPSLASPPPSESAPTRLTYAYHSPLSNITSFTSKGDEKYVLDPMFRGQTAVGKYVDEKSLVRSFKSRGPDPFPLRNPRQNPDILMDYDCDDIRYSNPPAFTLEHFLRNVAEEKHLALPQVRKIICSRHNVKKLTDLLVETHIHPRRQTEINTVKFDPEEKNVPLCEPRVPQHQLLLEMAAMIRVHMRQHMQTDVRTIIKPAPKYNPSYHGGDAQTVPHTEIILYENDAQEQATLAMKAQQESEAPGRDAVIHSAKSRYFQDSARERSCSPFAPPEEGSISPSELAILDSLIAGGTALSLKAHFIDALPDITPLMRTIVYLNLSFNNFKFLPPEVLDLWLLEVLKARDNPLIELPQDIDRLRNLSVLDVSYSLITTLPPGLFTLENLQHLNVSYNRLTFLPNAIKFLRKLEILNVEGNELPALPPGCLHLRLQAIFVRNNFMHPLFWKEHIKQQPQRLSDLAMLELHQRGLSENVSTFPDIVLRLMKTVDKCDCCRGPLYGPGLRMIRPVPLLFGVKHIPIMFHSCSPHCLNVFKGLSGKQLAEILYEEESTT